MVRIAEMEKSLQTRRPAFHFKGRYTGRDVHVPSVWNAGDAVSINGNLPNFDNFLQDGASTILPASYNNDDEIFETIQEVQVNTSSFSAQQGTSAPIS